jgi:hypothetical protein
MVPIIARLMDRGFVAGGRPLARAHPDRSGAQNGGRSQSAHAAHEARFVTQLAAGEVETLLRCLPTIRGTGAEPEG